MTVEQFEKEIVVTYRKGEDNTIFERYQVVKNPKKFFEFVLRLEWLLNGESGIQLGYETIDDFKDDLPKIGKKEINKIKKDLYETIFYHIDHFYEIVPEEFRPSWDAELLMVDQYDTLSDLKYASDKLRLILAYKKQNKNNLTKEEN